ERVDMTTGSGNDTLTGGALADRFSSGAGNDTINAGTKTAGSNAIDGVDGGADTDTRIVDASAGAQGRQLFAGGSPRLGGRSNSGNFYVDAYNMEKVQFTGGAGNDTIGGGPGADSLTGGKGADQFVFSIGPGVDTVADFSGQTAFGGGTGQHDH